MLPDGVMRANPFRWLQWTHGVLACLAPALVQANAWSCLEKPDDWFRGREGRETLTRVLSWQAGNGAWPKNVDTTGMKYEGDRKKLRGTFDNGATTGELRLLARAWAAGGDEAVRTAFRRGWDHVLVARHPCGGWPQFHPPGGGYHRHVTFNDGSMVRILEMLRDGAEWGILDERRRAEAARALEAGIGCILRCQIVTAGRRTVWCAQHDETTLEPVGGRSYELPSLSGSESAGILRFLMTIPEPTPEIRACIEAGVAWFAESKIEGFRYERQEGRMVRDSDAGPLWARFYDLRTGRPIFADRDGVKVFELTEVGMERRLGYAWYGNWGLAVERDYLEWRLRNRDMDAPD